MSRYPNNDPVTTREILPPVNPFLGLLPVEYWNRVKDFFVYFLEWLPLTASATLATSVNIDSSSDFVCLAMTGSVTATDDTTNVAVPHPFLLTLKDGVSARDFSVGANAASGVHWDNMVGTGNEPFYLPYPKIFRRNGIVTATLQNLSATDRHVRLALVGFKVFPEGIQG